MTYVRDFGKALGSTSSTVVNRLKVTGATWFSSSCRAELELFFSDIECIITDNTQYRYLTIGSRPSLAVAHPLSSEPIGYNFRHSYRSSATARATLQQYVRTRSKNTKSHESHDIM